jgi:hypothetical protein
MNQENPNLKVRDLVIIGGCTVLCRGEAFWQLG